jgi:hypothetical protein
MDGGEPTTSWLLVTSRALVETLLKIAFAYEQATRHRRPPTYRATIDG